MITLSKSGNTVTFTFDENSGYLQNGTIDVPVNSLSLILDESDMVTFRKSASNDIFISARYDVFGMTKEELEAWYKANMVGSTGGSDITSGDVQTMIDESISGLTVELTQAEYDALVSAGTVASDTYYIITDASAVDISNYWTSAQTQSAITSAVSGKASQSDLETVSGQVANKQDTLSAGTNITISGNVISAEGGSITVDSALDSGSTNPVENRVIYNKIDEVEQVTAAALNNINDRLSEDEEVTAAGLNALNDAFGGLKLMKISQTNYDNLQVKDQNTLYIVI